MRYDYPQRALDAVREMLKVARDSGVNIEISHLVANVYGNDNIEKALLMIKESQKEGLDISADVYPYDAWGTTIKSAVFDEGWLDNFNFSYKDIEILTEKHTGERCTKECFDTLRAKDQDKFVACHNAIPIYDICTAVQDPLVCIVSDGQMTKDAFTVDLKEHPRSAG